MGYRFEKITDKKGVELFHDFQANLYNDCPAWIPPFRFEIEKIFDPAKNSFFQTGECERFMMFSSKGQPVARFALMNQPKRDAVLSPKMGGFGFLELVNDQQVMDQIIAFASAWHQKRGYSAFRGPINFGENDNFWGLLVENYEEEPIYGMHYHHSYYKQLVESSGAQKLDDHWSYRRDFDQPLPERLVKITDRIEERLNVEIRPVDFKNPEKDAEAIRHIYNRAWADQDILDREEEFTELTHDTVMEMVKQMKRIIINDSVLIAFIDGVPASFIVSIPDLNQVSKKTGGRMRWWQIPALFLLKRNAKRLRTLVFGTLPDYRKKGLEALVFIRGIQMTKAAAPTLEYLEGAWVSEKNWLMQRSLEALGCHHHKTHRTYKWEW
jgi:hypothetical protein